ncbi:MAG TPA: dual specificity protein phosphatase family protein [Candidatus Binatia bacterium]|jgi:hypothetical protein|nr:dual specificity protein phosphatase family protein [Candidatus Binatia bacterium]
MPGHREFEYSEITPLLYVGNNACCADHFSRMLAEKGIRADISLEEARIDAPLGAEYYLWLPTPDHAPLAAEKLELGVATLAFFERQAIPCYVHCMNGHGRAPSLVAAHLIASRGLGADEAAAFIKERRPSIHLEPSQLEALRAFAAMPRPK